MGQVKALIFQSLCCFFVLGLCSILYLEKQNKLTQMRLYAPKLAQEIKGIQEENARLRYQLQEFESPGHLMQFLQEERFSHLKHPACKDILVLLEGKEFHPIESSQTFVAGAP
jgi:hypothetical protein